jgi:hypothetical protein
MGITISDHENTCFAEEMAEAKRRGDLIVTRPGETALESIKRHMQAKKKTETVSVRLPAPLIAAIKRQAKMAAVPWTAYMREVLAAGVSRMAKA